MQVLKETKEKGISLRTTSYLMVIISVIIAVALLFTGIRAFRSFRAMERSTDDYIALTEAASELMSASDYLTEEVQCFTVMGDRDAPPGQSPFCSGKRNAWLASAKRVGRKHV